MANAAQATAVAAKAFFQAESDHNGTESQMQYAACNSAVNDMIQILMLLQQTTADPLLSVMTMIQEHQTTKVLAVFKWRVNSVIYKSYSKQNI